MGNFARDKPGPGLNLGQNSKKGAVIFLAKFFESKFGLHRTKLA